MLLFFIRRTEDMWHPESEFCFLPSDHPQSESR